MQRTIEVAHPDTHEPTIEQLRAAVVSTLKDEGLKLNGSYSAKLKSQTSGQSSKYLIDFEADSIPKRAKGTGVKSKGIEHPADGTLSPEISGDGSGEALAPVGIEDVAHEDLT